MGTAIMWFRRDLRLRDHPALRESASRGAVLPLFVIDPSMWGPAGAAKTAWLAATLRALDASLDGRLVIRLGDRRAQHRDSLQGRRHATILT